MDTQSREEQRGPVEMQAPYPLAMVVCDAIWRDPSTGKRFLLGAFSAIGAKSFPAVHPLMALYVVVTDGHGKIPLRIRLVDAEEQLDPLAQSEAEVTFEDPRVVLEIDFHMQNITFPKAGEYRFQLYAGDELMMERRIVLAEMKGKANE